MTSTPPSDHFDGTRFFNPGVNTDKGFKDLLRWRRENKRTPWPDHVEPQRFPPPPTRVEADEASFTFIGQSTWLIRLPDLVILTDPIFSERASPFSFAGPKRVRPPGVAMTDLPPVDLVLLSHNHYDHLDLASLRALRDRCDPLILTGLENGRYLGRKGIPRSTELDWWQSTEPRPGVHVTYVPAQHWSSRTLRDRRRMLWGGFVVESGGTRIYFAGDTGYFDGFRRIRERCGAPDVALLPIGAYEPRWFMRTQHTNPDDAVLAHKELESGLSLAMHWGTFQLTDEGIDAPLIALDAAREQHGVAPDAFQTPVPGETVLWRRR